MVERTLNWLLIQELNVLHFTNTMAIYLHVPRKPFKPPRPVTMLHPVRQQLAANLILSLLQPPIQTPHRFPITLILHPPKHRQPSQTNPAKTGHRQQQ